jgi:DNA repair exonuclease SbcCD ATPase subunit
MKKINGFTITRLTVSGFKSFAEEKSFDFGGTTFIHGQNACGKSSIADAIAFAVTGQPFIGDKSSDRLGNPECDAMQVTMDFIDETGQARSLIRSRKNGKMSIAVDGCAVRQTDLTEMFGERDVFLSIFNPLYFIEELADGGKALLEKLLPPVPHERVLAEMSDPSRALLENEKLSNPQTYLQNRRAEIRELEDALVYQQGQDDLVKQQTREKEQLLAEYRQQAEERELTADGEILAQLQELERRLGERRAAQYTSQYAPALAEMNAEVNSLLQGYARFAQLQKEEKCPTCLQPAGDAEPIRAVLSEIVTKGKSLKAQIAETEALDQQAREVFEQFKAGDIAKLETELEGLRDRYEKTQKLLDSIEEIQVWLAANAPSTERADAITEQIRAKKALVAAAVDYIGARAILTFAAPKMNRVNISLFDVKKSTGEVKDVFRFTYNGKPYRWLSLSEKIRAGLEVSELIQSLSGRRYPVFIDNGESVTVIDNVRPSGQVLYAKVAHGLPLTVTVKEQAQAQAAA